MQLLMPQQDKQEDFVITAKMITLRKFIELCANEFGWEPKIDLERGIIDSISDFNKNYS